MNTTMTTGNIQEILRLAEQKGLVPDRTTRIIASGVLADAFDKDADLSNRDAWRAAFKLSPLTPPLTPPPLFRFIETVDVPATDRFEVDRIKVDIVDRVEIGYVDSFFTKYFSGLVEKAQAPMTFRRNELTRRGSCAAINSALGKGVEEATFGQVLWMMANGKIRKDGKATILRVQDAKGILRLVDIRWSAGNGDWGVFAYEVVDTDGWSAECPVFSRTV